MPAQNTEVKSSLSQFERAMEGAQFQSEEAKEAHALYRDVLKGSDEYRKLMSGLTVEDKAPEKTSTSVSRSK